MKLDYNDFKDLFGDWAELFRPFIESEKMFNIYQTLKEDAFDSQTGRRKEFIVPDSDSVFRAFSTTKPDRIKSVWYLMDPYPRRYKNRKNQATGIAMDCSNSPDGKLQPSLEYFYRGMEEDLGKKVTWTNDLTYLHSQGVMLLNTDLTCKLRKTGSHKGLWEPFQKFFLENIMADKPGIIYVLSGKESHRMERYISPFEHIIKIEHPMAADHRKDKWKHQNIFTKTNEILDEQGKSPIYWDATEYAKELEDLPF